MTLELASTPFRASARTHSGVAGALVSAVATTLASLQTARATRRHRSRGSPPVTSFLRRDVGLVPEVLEPKSHWDYL